jgi:outer membrane protein OmpA-like peptidoglycan-associated protein
MSDVSTAINRDGSAYRRGLVLGLTMAEIMLLLVFCLLIASAVVFKRDREVREDLTSKVETSASELGDAVKEVERLKVENAKLSQDKARLRKLAEEAGASPEEVRKLDDEWRKLVASDEAVRRMRAAGLSPESVVANAADIKVIEGLLSQGVAGNDMAAAVARARALDAALASPELSGKSDVELARLAAAGLESEKKADGEHDWPPIINLSEAKGYSFPVGRAGLSTEFADKLRTSIADDVVGILERYDATVVEVIGHTDEQAMAPRPSNLDSSLVSVLNGSQSVDRLVPGDNAGLGMSRAVSVAGLLRADPRFADVTILPLSGGQLILPGDVVTDGSSVGDARERRRIEIRVRRSEGAPGAP